MRRGSVVVLFLILGVSLVVLAGFVYKQGFTRFGLDKNNLESAIIISSPVAQPSPIKRTIPEPSLKIDDYIDFKTPTGWVKSPFGLSEFAVASDDFGIDPINGRVNKGVKIDFYLVGPLSDEEFGVSFPKLNNKETSGISDNNKITIDGHKAYIFSDTENVEANSFYVKVYDEEKKSILHIDSSMSNSSSKRDHEDKLKGLLKLIKFK